MHLNQEVIAELTEQYLYLGGDCIIHWSFPSDEELTALPEGFWFQETKLAPGHIGFCITGLSNKEYVRRLKKACTSYDLNAQATVIAGFQKAISSDDQNT